MMTPSRLGPPPPGVPSRFHPLDAAITESVARYGVTVIGVGLRFIFFWFGALKFVSGSSPAVPHRRERDSATKPVVALSVRSDPDGSWLRRPRKVDQKQAVCCRDCCPRMLSGDDRNLALTNLYPLLSYT